MGPLLKPNVCAALHSVLQKHVIRKTHFLWRKVLHSLSCAWSTAYFSFSSWTVHDMYFGTLLWKLKTYLVSLFLCLFYFTNHVYRKDIINGILQMELYLIEHSSTLKKNLYKKLYSLTCCNFNKVTVSQSRHRDINSRKVLLGEFEYDQTWLCRLLLT